MKFFSLLSALYLVTSCSQAPLTRTVASVPRLGQEQVPPEEEEATKEILALLAQGYNHHRPGETKGRIIHHKEHGCVRADFRVLPNLPEQLRSGIFKSTKSYPAWIRLSNGSGERKHDSVPDGRGLAIKLMGVPGEKLGFEKETQDFLLQSAPNFFSKDVADYVKFMKMATKPGFRGVGELLRDVNLRNSSDRQSIAILAASADLPSNPLSANYFSALPQKLGSFAMKLKAQECPGSNGTSSGVTGRLRTDYLKQTMAAHLSKKSACIELLVQVQTDVEKMPIENAMVTWDPALSQFVPVAHITIPKQVFLSTRRQQFCENLSFNPWHSISEHRPLGGLNRVRKLVYEHSQQHRHNHNNQTSQEPIPGERHE